MGAKEYFSTGEVSQLLNISRATVSRKFDSGIFYGKKNPITGERLISRDSLLSFMRQYNIPLNGLEKTAQKNLLVSSNDEQLQSHINDAFSGDNRIKISAVASGYDALIMCSKTPPDLFIIDDELSDISSAEAVKSLKRQDENADMKILCCLETQDNEKIMEIDADDYFAKDTMETVTLTKKVTNLLNISSETQPSSERFDHKRSWPRIKVDMPADLELYRVNTLNAHEEGKAKVENISLGGAYLSQIKLEKGNIPTDTFRFMLGIDQPPLKDWHAECKVVRLKANGALTAGIQFVNLSQINKNKIASIS